MFAVLRDLRRWSGPVTRAEYLRVGATLMALKYAVDALAYFLAVGAWWNPLDWLSPIYAQRMAAAPHVNELPPALLAFLLAWGLLFAGIGAHWSARRALDAGHSPWFALLFFAPVVNYLLILALLAAPSAERAPSPRRPLNGEDALALSLGGGVLLAGGLLGAYWLMVEATGGYGVVVFLGLPIALGVGAGLAWNRPAARSIGSNLAMSAVLAFVACGALLLFALEGVVCLAMAYPLLFVAVAIGVLLARGFSTVPRPGARTTACIALLLPASAWLDAELPTPPAREVATHVVVDAPPEVVWEHVVAFPDLPGPDEWWFEAGIAYPVGARIDGAGVGAVRRCEFSTGAFVEPITVWDAPRRLAFDVASQPLPMEEWSFYEDVSPPHLHGAFRSVRGEFRLVRLDGGRTRLEGSTWYELDLAPEPYWRLWGDAVIHRIHGRVLRHVKDLSEAAVREG